MMEYVLMNESHVPQIAQLEKMCFSTPWSEAVIASELTSRFSLWIVAEDQGKVIGYVGVQTVLGESDIMLLAVHPDFRRKGIGERLIAELIDKLKQQGSCCVTLDVRISNAPAIALYEKMGFVQVGRRPGYYYKPTEDALIMRKEWPV